MDNTQHQEQQPPRRPTGLIPVAVVGTSLLLDGVASSLAGRPSLAVSRIDPQATDLAGRLKLLQPVAVIFEVDHPVAAALLALHARSECRLVLIGLDFAGNCMVVTERWERLEPSMDDVGRVVENAARRAIGHDRGGSMREHVPTAAPG